MTTAERWSGSWGDSYTDRNIGVLSSSKRGAFWSRFFDTHPVKSVLEIGCNAGGNLRHLRADRICGVDVNAKALSIARLLPDVNVTLAEATHIPYPDASFDLVFTCGLLIHLPDSDLGSVMDEMFRLSTRYLMSMEYETPETREWEYRGERGLLWSRPYETLFLKRFSGLSLVDEGFLSKEEGFDDIVWNLFEKP